MIWAENPGGWHQGSSRRRAQRRRRVLQTDQIQTGGGPSGGAVSSLELVRRLDTGTRRAYFEVAKECITKREFPDHWKEMVFVLLKKKHGDQRKVRKMREIALMDQVLKLMLKCVKRLSFDRMVL